MHEKSKEELGQHHILVACKIILTGFSKFLGILYSALLLILSIIVFLALVRTNSYTVLGKDILEISESQSI